MKQRPDTRRRAQGAVAVNLLALGVMAINLFVYAMAGLVLLRSRQQYERRATIETQNLARSLAANVAGVLDKLNVGLFAVTQEVERQMTAGGIQTAALDQYLAAQQAQIGDFEGMWVADQAGHIQWGSDLTRGQWVDISDREYFRRLRVEKDPGLVISRPVMGRVTKAWSVLVARRINHPDGSFAGVALGSLRAVDYFTAKFSTINVGHDGRIALWGEDLSLIARYPATMQGSGQPGSRVISRAGMASVRANPITGTYTTADGQDGIVRTYSYQKVAGYPLLQFVAWSRQEYLAPWRIEGAVTLGLVGTFTLLTVLLTRIFYRQASEREASREKAIRESIFDGIPDAVFYTDNLRNIVTINRAFTSILGYSLDELKGKDSHVFYAPGVAQEQEAHLQLDSGSGEPLQPIEVRFQRKNGDVFPGEIAGSIVRSDDGTRLGCVGVIREITERKRLESEIKDSQANLSALIGSTEDLIWSVDLEYRLVAFNTMLAEHIRNNYGTRAWIGAGPEDMLPPDRASLWPARYQRALTEGPFHQEYLLPDGRILDLHLNRVFRDKQVVGISVFGKDITERKRVEEALRTSEHHFQEALDYQPVPIAISKGDEIRHFNREFISTFGYTIEETPSIPDWMNRAYPDPAYREHVLLQWEKDAAQAIQNDENTPPREYLVGLEKRPYGSCGSPL